jgi:ligand-binding sensor domain-containing protein
MLVRTIVLVECSLIETVQNGWQQIEMVLLVLMKVIILQKMIGTDTGNLPASDVRALAIDNRNQLWIGTIKGLRVLPNIGNFQTGDQLTANPIIIVDDNLAQELLYEQFITDIAVDGANNKWIGTADSGLFVSPNGQETKYHFTINISLA